jgi:hypothetical protein
MNISQEEKDYLINQIEALIGERPLFYLKFCKEKDWANDVANGNLYGNTVEYFRKLEVESGEQGQGDKHELLNIIEVQRATAIDPETGNIILTTSSGQMKVEFGADKLIPLVSFVAISLRDMVLYHYDEKHAEFHFPFTDEECRTIKTKFGDYCTIVGAREIEAKIDQYCDKVRADYIFDKVVYCSQNTIQRMDAFNRGDKERFLYKNEIFAYQREYRLAVAIEFPDDHFIRIGKLNSANVFKSEEICNFRFSVEYTTVHKN